MSCITNKPRERLICNIVFQAILVKYVKIKSIEVKLERKEFKRYIREYAIR